MMTQSLFVKTGISAMRANPPGLPNVFGTKGEFTLMAVERH